MLARIQVIGNAPDVDEVENLLLERVVSAVGHAYAKPFLQRLEGWFYQRTDEMDAITGDEFDQIFTDLRNQFRPENLPIDEDIAVLEADPTDYANMTFVRQLDLGVVEDLAAPDLGLAVENVRHPHCGDGERDAQREEQHLGDHADDGDVPGGEGDHQHDEPAGQPGEPDAELLDAYGRLDFSVAGHWFPPAVVC